MMNVSVICVGKLKESYLREGCSEYIKRLGAFAKVSVIEVAEERCGDSPSASEIEKVLQKRRRADNRKNSEGRGGCAAVHRGQ